MAAVSLTLSVATVALGVLVNVDSWHDEIRSVAGWTYDGCLPGIE